jgi:transposase
LWDHAVRICLIAQIIREAELKCSPESVSGFLTGSGLKIAKVGLESGSLTHWLTKGLKDDKFNVVVMESTKMAAILKTIINKTDKNDARGIADALRAGHYSECIHRSDEAMHSQTIMNGRKGLVKARTAIINNIKGLVKPYGIKLGKGEPVGFRERVMEEINAFPKDFSDALSGLLNVLQMLNEEIGKSDKRIQCRGKDDEVIQLFKTIDGVGPITAAVYKAELDDPGRFQTSKNVPAFLGLTPRQYSSGEVHNQGRISKKGSIHLRYLLVKAANYLLTRCQKWSALKAWGLKIQKSKGHKKACVAVARKLAIIMHRMWVTKKPFDRKKPKEKIAA